MAREVGYQFRKEDRETMMVASGEKFAVYHGKIFVKIGPWKMKIRWVYSTKNKTPFLLGRVDFLDKFNINLSAKRKEIILEKISQRFD